MIAKLKAWIERTVRLVNYGAFLLDEIRRNNSVAVHFENQNALLFGTTEIVKKLRELEHLHEEIRKANQLMNLTAAELQARNASGSELDRRLAALESEVAALRAQLSQTPPNPHP